MDELAGALREQVTFERPSRVADGHGGVAISWTGVASLRAAVEAMPMDQDVAAGRQSHAMRYHVTVRSRADLAPGDRLVWRGRFLMIEAVPPARPDHPAMVLIAREDPGL